MTNKHPATLVLVLLLCGAAAVFVQLVEADTLTFDPPITLSYGTGPALSPRLILSGSNLYALWFQSPNVGEGQWDLMFRVSGDGGATWSPSLESPARNLSNNPPNGFGAEWPVAVVTNGPSIYLAWVDTALDPSGHVFFSRSDNGGQTFTQPVAVSQVNVGAEVELAIANGRLVLVYSAFNPNRLRRDLYVRTSTDGGTSWTPANLLAKQGVCTSESFSPQLATDGSVIAVLWNCGSTVFRRSRDGGLTFGATEILASENVLTPRLATASGTTYTAWTQGGPSGELTVRFRRSLDGGRTWDPSLDQPAAQVSDIPLIGGGPELVADESGVYVGWESAFGGNLRVRRSIDGGVTWDQSVEALPAGTVYCQLFLQAGELYAIGGSSSGLLFTRSTDGGVTWDLAQNLGSESGNAPGSTMAVSGRDVYVAWQGEGFPVNPILLRHAKAAISFAPFLAFPLENRTPETAYKVSYFDHSMHTPYCADGVVETFEGRRAGAPRTESCRPKTFNNPDAYTYNGLSYDGHPGYDFRTNDQNPNGEIPVHAAAGGQVTVKSDNFCTLIINHGNGYRTEYLHLSKRFPVTGQVVKEGEQIGVSGQCGAPNAPHLHFQVEKDLGKGGWVPVDPYGWTGCDGCDPYPVPSQRLWK